MFLFGLLLYIWDWNKFFLYVEIENWYECCGCKLLFGIWKYNDFKVKVDLGYIILF